MLASKKLYYSFLNRGMASNDESHRYQTLFNLYMQFKLQLGSVFIRANKITPSIESQIRKVP